MSAIDAFHLPGLTAADVGEWTTRDYGGGVSLRVPVLNADGLERVVSRITAAREQSLAGRPVDAIVAAVGRAADRLRDPDDEYRRTAVEVLPAVTGYSTEMIRLVLDRMTELWTTDALNALLRSEFGDPGVLDGFRAEPAASTTAGERRIRAFGPRLAFHIFAGNVPGVAVTSLVRSLLVKAATLGKTASGEPLLPALFARALADAAPELGRCLAVTYWPGGSRAIEAVALRAADTVVVYGGDAVVTDVRGRLPAGTRLVEHGPRISVGLVGRAALSDDAAPATAAEVARAVATFDQQGCVSPHVVWAEREAAVEPARFAALVAEALDALRAELPRGRISAAEAAAIRDVRGAAEFRALDGREGRVFCPDGTDYTVIYDAEPAFEPSCLNRVLRIKPVDRLEDAVEHVRPVARFLQTVGLAGADERRAALAERFGELGAVRITGFAAMPWPPGTWHHDGRGPLIELVRWADLEAGHRRA